MVEKRGMMKKTLYLMRHGETIFNVLGKIQGWCDSPLTPTGIAQAKLAGEYFRKNQISFDAAYCSTSERTSDTLELVTNHSMPYTRLKGLKEHGFGRFEGESEDLNPKPPYGDFFVPYGGEGEEEFRERISTTLTDIMKKDHHDTVLAVSHGGASINFMWKWKPYAKVSHEGRLPNCSILIYEFDTDTHIFVLTDIIHHDFSDLTSIRSL